MRCSSIFVVTATLFTVCRVAAQTFTVLHSFTNGPDGANPYCGLVLSGNILYGVAAGVGGSGSGPVYAVNTDGSGFTNLYSFTGNSGLWGPEGGLLLSSNTLYGTTWLGGVGLSGGDGIVYAVNTDGTGFTNLHTFTSLSPPIRGTNSDGANPRPILILSGNTLYGTATLGGSFGQGTVFAVNTDGSGFTNLHSFTMPYTNSFLGTYTNYDGAYPEAGLVLLGNTLYGTAEDYGGFDRGTVFSVHTAGTSFTNLHSFTGGSDGANPSCNLILSGNALYGTAALGGSFGQGTVFAVNTYGSGFTNLYSFTGGSDGAIPWAGLTLSGGTLYGPTESGGSSSNGTVFAISTNGTGFTSLYSFTGGSDGGTPNDQLVVSGNALYGTARYGGAGYGTVFRLSFAPQLTITLSGTNIALTWPTNFAGFDYTSFNLQSTTNLVSPAVWSTNLPSAVVVNGQNVVTNPVSGVQIFYRLSQ